MEKIYKRKHNYQVVRLLLVVLLMAGTAISGCGQVQFFTKFTTTDHWTKDDESSWNAYEGTKHYHEDGWHFSGKNAIRDGSAESYNESGYSFRSRGDCEISNTRKVSMTGFRIYIRDYRDEPRQDRHIKLSMDGGSSFEHIGTITDTFFGDDYGDGEAYHHFEHSFQEKVQTFSADGLLIKIEGHNVAEDQANQYRIRIGAFEVLGEPLSKKWSGSAGNTKWSDASNWKPTGTPGENDMVILDHTSVSGSYEVILPSGTNTVAIASLEIKPSIASETITLVLPDDNDANPGLELTDTWNALVLHDGAIFRNSSGASAGSGFELTGNDGNITIRNGGRYTHNTTRVHATAIVAKLSTAEGTEKGIFEFDVPGTADYSISTSGRIYSNLVISADAAGETRKYISSGSSPLTIRNNLIISNNAIFSIHMTGEVTVEQNLEIEQGGSVEFSPSAKTNVSGNMINKAGSSGLVFKSSDTGTGSLIHDDAGVAATVERYFAGAEQWHLIASPVADQSISGDWTPSGSYTGDTGYDFYTYDEENKIWRNQKVSGNNINNFVPGKGYLVSFETASYTPKFTDDLNNGNVTIAVTRNASGEYAGANLIGNPYASGIDWNEVDRTLFEDDYAYVYDANANGGSGAYIEVNGGKADAFIAPHQGFFVIKKTAGSDNFTFNNNMRVHGGMFTKQQQMQESLVLRLSGDTYYDKTTLRIRKNSGFERDRKDARKFLSYNQQAPQVYSFTSDHVQVSINSIPHINLGQPITLGLRIPADGEYTISTQETTGAFAVNNLLLEDTETAIIHDLQSNPEYSFQAEEGNIQERFVLHFSNPDDDATSITDTETPAARIWHHNNTLWVNSPDKNNNVTLYDINGRQLRHYQTGSGQHSFRINLPAGVYVVQLTTDTTQQSVRIVLK